MADQTVRPENIRKSETIDIPAWTHPTGKRPESVIVMALGPTKHDLLNMTTAHDPTKTLMDVDEVWGLNGGANWMCGRVAYDVLWMMDWIEGEARKEPQYIGHVMEVLARHNTKLITSQLTGMYASDHRMFQYPIFQVLDAFGTENCYFHNSIPYILAYALFIGVKSLTIFGADYEHEALKNRERDRANAEAWVFACRFANNGRKPENGMSVHMPDTTTLLNTNEGLHLYGYRDQPPVRSLATRGDDLLTWAVNIETRAPSIYG